MAVGERSPALLPPSRLLLFPSQHLLSSYCVQGPCWLRDGRDEASTVPAPDSQEDPSRVFSTE